MSTDLIENKIKQWIKTIEQTLALLGSQMKSAMSNQYRKTQMHALISQHLVNYGMA